VAGPAKVKNAEKSRIFRMILFYRANAAAEFARGSVIVVACPARTTHRTGLDSRARALLFFRVQFWRIFISP
jgi:hypothetical protein